MTPATRAAALDLVAEIVDRGLQRREQRVARTAKRAARRNVGRDREPVR